MLSEGAMAENSGDSVRSPLKRHKTKTSNPGANEHTSPVDSGDCPSKGSYEEARDIRVAKLKKMFKPVEEAAESL